MPIVAPVKSGFAEPNTGGTAKVAAAISLCCAALFCPPVTAWSNHASEPQAAPNRHTGDELNGVVRQVHDGDTITLTVDKRRYRLRLWGIDAPELRQPYGQLARLQLREWLWRRPVRALCQTETDRYGRRVCIVYRGAQDINERLLYEGLAWHYAQYADHPPYQRAEREARRWRAGLWRDDHPIAPWQWRRQKR